MSNPKNKYVKPHWKKPKDKHVRRGPAYEIVYRTQRKTPESLAQGI